MSIPKTPYGRVNTFSLNYSKSFTILVLLFSIELKVFYQGVSLNLNCRFKISKNLFDGCCKVEMKSKLLKLFKAFFFLFKVFKDFYISELPAKDGLVFTKVLLQLLTVHPTFRVENGFLWNVLK